MSGALGHYVGEHRDDAPAPSEDGDYLVVAAGYIWSSSPHRARVLATPICCRCLFDRRDIGVL